MQLFLIAFCFFVAYTVARIAERERHVPEEPLTTAQAIVGCYRDTLAILAFGYGLYLTGL